MTLHSFYLPDQLNSLKLQSLLRTPSTVSSGVTPYIHLPNAQQPLLNFSSNDYLGLASHADIIPKALAYMQQYGISGFGSGAAHLITGHSLLHALLQDRLASLTGYPKVLLFSTGCAANMGTIDALMRAHSDKSNQPDNNAIVYQDKLNHASLLDGARLAGVRQRRYPHLQTTILTNWLAADTPSRALIVSDSVFSMEGTLADISSLQRIANSHNAALMLDDAHGFGLRASPAPEVDVYMATLGKAIGVAGAFVAGSDTLIDYLQQYARSYVFTTASPPIQAAATLAALDILAESGTQLRTHLAQLVDSVNTQLLNQGWQLFNNTHANSPLHPTPIIMVAMDSAAQAITFSAKLQQMGIMCKAIRPPTAPTSRLRITLSANHTPAHIDQLIEAFAKLKKLAPSQSVI